MEWIEIIQLRPFAAKDRHEAIRAFRQLSPPEKEDGLLEMKLYQGNSLANELSISLKWRGRRPIGGKSGLGLQLAGAFAEFGLIDHSGWIMLESINLKDWRNIDAQESVI